MGRALPHPTDSLVRRRFVVVGAAIFFLFLILTPAGAATPQSMSPVVPVPVGSATPAATGDESLRSALAQVGLALNQVQIDHWKLSRQWKEQLRGDANSIQHDLSAQLPGLFQTAQQSPGALAPQWGVMHNVNALYDVLVRITMAANLSAGKTDAATLGNALLRLESARKAALSQLVQAASLQDQQIVKFRAQMQAAQNTETPANGHSKTIIVDNRVTHRARHHRTQPYKKPVPRPSTNGGTDSSNSHTTTP